MGIVPTFQQLIDKLNEMYDREESIIIQVRNLHNEYNQLQEDKEMLETMIMYKYNKDVRGKQNVSNFRANRTN